MFRPVRIVGIMRQRFGMLARNSVISKSDLVILVLASSALAVGVFRWHQNTQDVSAITIPASSRVSSEPIQGGSNAPATVNQNELAINTTLPAQATDQVRVQTIVDPTPVTEIVVTEATSLPNESESLGTHTVRSGDILGRIAQQYGTDVQTLRELNNIRGSLIQVGQEILYPL